MLEITTDKTFGDVPKGKHAMAVLGVEGDIKTIWDAHVPAEVAEARAQFERLTHAHKGYTAFRVTGKNGEQGEQMRTFDPEAERIIFAPQLVGG